MKKLIFLAIASIMALMTIAQVPQMFSYQAVVRDTDGNPIINSIVGIKIEIFLLDMSQTVIYTETHDVLTNDYGLVTLSIGDGTSADDFSAIDWGNIECNMRISLDIEDGTNYVEMGTSRFHSVPYAIYAEEARNEKDKVAFTVDNRSYFYLTSTSTTKLDMNNVRFDIDNNYDIDQDEFIAPYDGVYHFDAGIMFNNVSLNVYISVMLYVNGSSALVFGYERVIDADQYQQINGSGLLRLAEGDVVDLRIRATSDIDYSIYGHFTSNQYTYFSGHLVFRE